MDAEKLLRLALFSDSLDLKDKEDRTNILEHRRQELAESIRTNRKKGVVPVFVSSMWFIVALAISIQAAFNQLGFNETAHDLALGLLLAWLPVFILLCIIDRNPIATDAIRKQLNDLLDDVRSALADEQSRTIYMERIGRSDRSFVNWTQSLDAEYYRDFFVQFAGQGRLAWHYGVAHAILRSIEENAMAQTENGRNWLRDADAARTSMIWTKQPKWRGLHWFDPQMIWQIISSIFIVGGSVGGAFVLSCQ